MFDLLGWLARHGRAGRRQEEADVRLVTDALAAVGSASAATLAALTRLPASRVQAVLDRLESADLGGWVDDPRRARPVFLLDAGEEAGRG